MARSKTKNKPVDNDGETEVTTTDIQAFNPTFAPPIGYVEKAQEIGLMPDGDNWEIATAELEAQVVRQELAQERIDDTAEHLANIVDASTDTFDKVIGAMEQGFGTIAAEVSAATSNLEELDQINNSDWGEVPELEAGPTKVTGRKNPAELNEAKADKPKRTPRKQQGKPRVAPKAKAKAQTATKDSEGATEAPRASGGQARSHQRGGAADFGGLRQDAGSKTSAANLWKALLSNGEVVVMIDAEAKAIQKNAPDTPGGRAIAGNMKMARDAALNRIRNRLGKSSGWEHKHGRQQGGLSVERLTAQKFKFILNQPPAYLTATGRVSGVGKVARELVASGIAIADVARDDELQAVLSDVE